METSFLFVFVVAHDSKEPFCSLSMTNYILFIVSIARTHSWAVIGLGFGLGFKVKIDPKIWSWLELRIWGGEFIMSPVILESIQVNY